MTNGVSMLLQRRWSLAARLSVAASVALLVAALNISPARPEGVGCADAAGWTRVPTPYAPRSSGSPGITSVARDVSAPGRLFITTLISGLNVSEDCGRSWVSRGLSGAFQVVVDQVGTIYVSSYSEWIRVSHDRGSTWNRAGLVAGEKLLGIDAEAIGHSPVQPGLAFATFGRSGRRVGAFGGRSEDGGLTWRHTTDGWVDGGHVVPGIRPEDVYVATYHYVHRSSDGGATFGRIASFDARITGFATAPDGSRFWLATEGGALLLSRDDAASWSPVAPVPTGGTLVYLSADPARPDTLYAVHDKSEVWVYRDSASSAE